MQTSVAGSKLGRQCPDFVSDLTSNLRPKIKVAEVPNEFDLQLWDLLLCKRRPIKHLEASLHSTRQGVCDPELLLHEVDFFTTAEAESQEKI